MESARPWVEGALLATGLLAVTVAGAVAADLSSARVWTLVAVLAALYMLSRGAARSPGGRPRAPRATTFTPAPPAAPPPAPEPPPAPRVAEPVSETAAEVVLSEERLNVTSRARPRERVQVRKEIVTREVTITVPVRHEELRIERVPLDAPGHPDAEVDVTLMTHEPVVTKEIVPRERVRLEKDVVTERERISEPVRAERVELDRTTAPDPHRGAR